MNTEAPAAGRAPSAARLKPQRPLPWLEPAIFTGALVPLAAILALAYAGRLGANPVVEALNRLGLLALILLLLSLACSPLKALYGWTWPIRIRKTLGLYGFFYACCHFLTYAGLDQALNLRQIGEDITKRRFIFVGFSALCLLVPLAVTSTSGMLKRLGFAGWKRLHRLAYVAAGLGVIHFIWRVKKDLTEPLVYGAVLGVLLLLRLLPEKKKSRAR